MRANGQFSNDILVLSPSLPENFKLHKRNSGKGRIAVITVEPAGTASFVLGCIQTRLMGRYNGI